MVATKPRIEFVPTPELAKLLTYYVGLEEVHKLLAMAQKRVEEDRGLPVCIEECRGLCCQHNSVVAWGVEAEWAASVILGVPGLLDEVLNRARAWLTEPGKWSYGRTLNMAKWKALKPELFTALSTRCCFVSEEGRCLIHMARPMVCRTYGVTRMPGYECPRPKGRGEDDMTRTWFHPDTAEIPVRPAFDLLLSRVKEARFARQGFFALMLFERFRAKELAGLVDDGKVPLVKLHIGYGEGLAMLWQEQLDREWTYAGADSSVATQVPLTYINGNAAIAVGKRRR